MPTPCAQSAFVISLDFELMWGVRDHLTKEQYGRNVLGAREAIPRLLDCFAGRNLRATWATVGLLFCESKDEMLATRPSQPLRYARAALNNYDYLGEVGPDERRDPYYFGASLIDRITAAPGQEIGTHTFSHFYCLEPGATDADFAADLAAAVKVAERQGVRLRSIVFPRNQYDDAKIELCRRFGLKVYRGNEIHWLYRSSAAHRQTRLRRGLRLLDAYLDVGGSHTTNRPTTPGAMLNVASSRFLRPYSRRLAALEPIRLDRIRTAMSRAAAIGGIFHLWWHPHNFGADLEPNMRCLGAILDHFTVLQERTGMVSCAMGDFAADVEV